MEEETKSSKNIRNNINDGKITKTREKLNRNKLAATAADKLDDHEWRCLLVESGRHKSGGRRSTGRVISIKEEEKKDAQGDDKKDDSSSEIDSGLD